MSVSNAPMALLLCALLAGTSLAASCASEGQGPEPDLGPESNQQAMEEEDEQDVWNDINR